MGASVVTRRERSPASCSGHSVLPQMRAWSRTPCTQRGCVSEHAYRESPPDCGGALGVWRKRARYRRCAPDQITAWPFGSTSLPEVKLERIEPETLGAIANGVHQNAHMAEREGLILRVR